MKVEPTSVAAAVPRPRLTFRGVLREVVHDVVHLDFSTVRTFVGLIRRPGQVAREQIVDHSEAYVRPLSYAFWTSTAYLLVNSLTATPVSPFVDPLSGSKPFWPYLGMLALLPIAGLQRLHFPGHRQRCTAGGHRANRDWRWRRAGLTYRLLWQRLPGRRTSYAPQAGVEVPRPLVRHGVRRDRRWLSDSCCSPDTGQVARCLLL